MISNVARFIKDGLVQNYKILLLALVIASISFPSFHLYYVPGIDGPLAWVFNYFADGHFLIGKDLLFPHGPLAFLLYPLPQGNNLTVAILVYFSVSVFLSMSVYRIYFLKKSENFLSPTLLLLVLKASLDLQLQVIALCISQFILAELQEKKKNLVFALFFAVFNLYIKSYGGIICLLLIGSVFLYQVLVKKNYKNAGSLVFYFFVFFFSFWLSLYHQFSGALTFLRGQFELATDNSEAVSFYQVNNWWWISICFLALAAIPFFTKDKQVRTTYFWLLLPLFGAWKHAMSRGDETHVAGFLSFLFLFCVIIWLISEENKNGILILGIMAISAFTLQMASTSQYNDYSKQKELALFRPFNLYQVLGKEDSVYKKNNRISDIVNQHEKLPDSILKIIRSNTADIFPWNHSVIAVNRLNWVTRPSLHSYTSYTHWLDKKNAEHYQSESSANFIIWQIDQLGGKLNSIDSRYLLNDAPQAIIAFLSQYHLVYKDSKFLVYKKLAKPYPVKIKTITENKASKYDTWIYVPRLQANCINRIKINISKSFSGILKSALYKGESFSIYYELANGQTISHKLVPKNAQDGAWLNPLILSPETSGIEPLVKKVKVVCWDKKMVSSEFDYSFEEIRFENDTDLLWRTFGKRDSVLKN